MDGQPTRGGLAARAPAAWQDFFGFLRRPALPDRARGVGTAGMGAIARLFPLDLLLMGLLIGGFAALAAFGIELPAHALENLDLGPGLIAFIVIGAPIGEEILFRGWLSGRPGHFLAIPFVLAALIALMLAAATGQFDPNARGGGVLIALFFLLLASGVLFALRKRPALGWFQRHFGWFYFASALAFAGIHLFNFGDGVTAAMLPLTLPQFVLGLMLGYVRVIHGLWASVLLHALHNSVFIGLVLAATSAA